MHANESAFLLSTQFVCMLRLPVGGWFAHSARQSRLGSWQQAEGWQQQAAAGVRASGGRTQSAMELRTGSARGERSLSHTPWGLVTFDFTLFQPSKARCVPAGLIN